MQTTSAKWSTLSHRIQVVFWAWLNKCLDYNEEDVLSYETSMMFKWYTDLLYAKRSRPIWFLMSSPFNLFFELLHICFRDLLSNRLHHGVSHRPASCLASISSVIRLNFKNIFFPWMVDPLLWVILDIWLSDCVNH